MAEKPQAREQNAGRRPALNPFPATNEIKQLGGRDSPPSVRSSEIRAVGHSRGREAYAGPGVISPCVRHRSLTFFAVLLLACLTPAVLGLSDACSTSSDEPFSDCAGLCFDCACCPNGISSLGEMGPAIGALVSLYSAFPAVANNPLDAPPADILHIPKPTIS